MKISKDFLRKYGIKNTTIIQAGRYDKFSVYTFKTEDGLKLYEYFEKKYSKEIKSKAVRLSRYLCYVELKISTSLDFN